MHEIAYWGNRAHELAQEERAGKLWRLNADIARRRAEDLAGWLERRLAQLAGEREIVALAPELKGTALIVPAGLLRRWAEAVTPGPTPSAFAEHTGEVESLAMGSVMAAERAVGRVDREPLDVSARKVGDDREHRSPHGPA